MASIPVCKDEESFKQLVQKAGSQLVVLHFEADWADECKQMNDVLAELAKEYTHTIFIRVEAEDVADISQHYEVECVPTFVLLKERKVLTKVEGADAGKLSSSVKYHATSFVVPTIKPSSTENLEERLKRLINAHSCMLFMKGSPAEPRCGFSRQTIQILQEQGVKFGTFDILGDNEVRQGLKTYSDWPTYPQLYINGELVGGLDIIKELVENGELADMLPKPEDLNKRLEKLIKQHKMMIFMKGEREAPRCKFSRALMELLKPYNLDFQTFDILEDEEVRQGLKSYSNWPTYPQIYVNGELVGGLDIIKELKDNDELLSTLNPTS